MLGIKDVAVCKTIILSLLLIFIIAVLIGKNSNAVMRFMVGQEIGLKTADFNQVKTDNFVIKYTIIDDKDIDMVSNASEYAYEKVTGFFASKPRNKTMVVVYPDTISLAQSFGWDKSQKAEGVYWAGSIRIISPQLWQEQVPLTDDADLLQAGPLVHEFAHLMVDEQTRGNYNRWWTEGIAQYAEKKITGFEFDEPFASEKEVFIYSLDHLNKKFDGDDSLKAYWQALQIIEYIAANDGEASLFCIMDHLGEGDTLRQAITKTLSVDYDEWEQELYKALQNNAVKRCKF